MTQTRFVLVLGVAALYVWGGASFYTFFDEFVQRVAVWNIYEASLDLILAFFVFALIPRRWVAANTFFFAFYVLVFIKHLFEVAGCNLVRIVQGSHIDSAKSVCSAASGFEYWALFGTIFGLLYAAWTVRRWYVIEYRAAPKIRSGSYMGFRKLKHWRNLGIIKTAFIMVFPFSSMSARLHSGIVYSYRRETMPDGRRALHGKFVARPAADIDLDSYAWVPLPPCPELRRLDEARVASGEIWTLTSNCVTAICIPHYWTLIRGLWRKKWRSAC